MKRKLTWLSILLISMSAYMGYAYACQSSFGAGDNDSCHLSGSCAGFVGILVYGCVQESCFTNWGDGCFPANYQGCVLGGCLNPFDGNCVHCGGPPTDTPGGPHA